MYEGLFGFRGRRTRGLGGDGVVSGVCVGVFGLVGGMGVWWVSCSGSDGEGDWWVVGLGIWDYGLAGPHRS